MKPLTDIIDGFFTFKKQFLANQYKQYKTPLLELSQKQAPKTLIISCSDSRVDPAILFNADLGEFFIIRNVANIVPPFQDDHHSTYHGTSAALEFAVKILKIKNILIVGHSNCGGIKALLEYDPELEEAQFKYILDWVFILKEAKEKMIETPSTEETYHECEKMSVKISMKNLKTFPFIQEELQSENLNIYGLYLSLANMTLHQYSEASDQFELLTPKDED